MSEKILPDELKDTIFQQHDFVYVETIQDKSALLHAIFFAMNKSDYRKKNDEERKTIINDYRSERLSSKYYRGSKAQELNSIYYTTLFDNNNTSYSSEDIIKKNREYLENLDKEFRKDLLKIFEFYDSTKTKVVIVNTENTYSSSFKCVMTDKEKDKYKKIIFILSKNGNYYPLVIKDSSSSTNYEEPHSIDRTFVKNILKKCEDNRELISFSDYIEPNLFKFNVKEKNLKVNTKPKSFKWNTKINEKNSSKIKTPKILSSKFKSLRHNTFIDTLDKKGINLLTYILIILIAIVSYFLYYP